VLAVLLDVWGSSFALLAPFLLPVPSVVGLACFPPALLGVVHPPHKHGTQPACPLLLSANRSTGGPLLLSAQQEHWGKMLGRGA